MLCASATYSCPLRTTIKQHYANESNECNNNNNKRKRMKLQHAVCQYGNSIRHDRNEAAAAAAAVVRQPDNQPTNQPVESLRMFIQLKRCVVLVDCWIKFKDNKWNVVRARAGASPFGCVRRRWADNMSFGCCAFRNHISATNWTRRMYARNWSSAFYDETPI